MKQYEPLCVSVAVPMVAGSSLAPVNAMLQGLYAERWELVAVGPSRGSEVVLFLHREVLPETDTMEAVYKHISQKDQAKGRNKR